MPTREAEERPNHALMSAMGRKPTSEGAELILSLRATKADFGESL